MPSTRPLPRVTLAVHATQYNGVLRGMGGKVDSLVETFDQLCMGNKYARHLPAPSLRISPRTTSGDPLRRYATTLHVINSAIVKLSKLTPVDTVYRGVSGGVLPDEFWKPNEHKVPRSLHRNRLSQHDLRVISARSRRRFVAGSSTRSCRLRSTSK